MNNTEKSYELAKERYAELGVDTDAALETLKSIPISVNCWQGDDVTGFEHDASGASGGIMATGNYPGAARTADELRSDLDQALALIPGTHRLNLHAIYAETGEGYTDRDELKPEHFENWIKWAKNKKMGLDFNPTFFSHPKADSGFTLSSNDESIRNFWIEHGKACRRISEHMGRSLGTKSVMNIWAPDGFKDMPVDRKGYRQRLNASLDAMCAEQLDPDCHKDAVESKLFGIGAESCTIGSHEFYMGYAMKNDIILCLDAGHYHPTEVISDKLSAIMQFIPEVLLHVSRPVRWDSDHVVILSDEVRAIANEIIRGEYLDRVHIGLDFFDATINRVAAWVIGTRSMLKALCFALLEPTEKLRDAELAGDYTTRLATLEELKTMPAAAVWDYYCQQMNTPVGVDWLKNVREYEKKVLGQRA